MFDRGAWRLTVPRAAAAALIVAFAATAWRAGGLGRLAAVLLLVDVTVAVLPWRLPRSRRSVPSIWLEAVLRSTVLSAFAVVVLVRQEPWIVGMPSPWWLAGGVAVGLGLVALGGMNLRDLLSGGLAFVAPPIRRGHKAERVTSAAVAPLGEEALFRGLALSGPHAASLPLALLGAAAFVARHHTGPDPWASGAARRLLTQVVAAAAFTTLTLASHSVLPALVAHWLNNAPVILFELQREVEEG